MSGLQAHSSATIGGKLTDTGEYAVQTLTLPGLKPKTLCSYTIVDKFYSARPALTPEESTRIKEENQKKFERKGESGSHCQQRM